MLFHLSLDRIPGNALYPRVPKIRAKGENDTIERISFAPSIKRCITAMPSGIPIVQNLIALEKKLGIPAIMHLYLLDETKLSADKIVNNNILVEQNLVPDAFMTGEVWVLEPVICQHEVIHIKDIDVKTLQIGCIERKYVYQCLAGFEIMPFDRTFTVPLPSLRSYASFLNYLDRHAYVTTNCGSLDPSYHEVEFTVPAGVDAGPVLEKAWHLFWKHLSNKYYKKTGKPIGSKHMILANLGLGD